MRDKGDSAFDDVIDDREESSPGEKTRGKASGNNDATGSDGDELVSNSDAERTLSNSQPAIDFDDVSQHAVYMLQGTWDGVEDTKYYAEGVLREEYGIRNVTTRELDQVIGEIICDEVSAELIAQRLVELRGFDSEE